MDHDSILQEALRVAAIKEDVYTIDITADSFGDSCNKVDNRSIISQLSCGDVKSMINVYTEKHGSPRFVSGVILWINKKDVYCFSIYKNGKALDLMSLKDLK